MRCGRVPLPAFFIQAGCLRVDGHIKVLWEETRSEWEGFKEWTERTGYLERVKKFRANCRLCLSAKRSDDFAG